MFNIGTIRITTLAALPFGREKLRVAMLLAGINQVAIGQAVTTLSGLIREHVPADICLTYEDHKLCINLYTASDPAHIMHQMHYTLRMPLGNDELGKIKLVIERLSREELLHDLEKQVADRTTELNLEREKTEKLLLNMLPRPIVERMKTGQRIADRREASVMFVDIVAFTNWASTLTPSALLEHLDYIFSSFDRSIYKFGLEKIKTIGDSYMAASGIPLPQEDHVDRAVKAGLDILRSLPEIRKAISTDLDLRIGIHCGSLVAGVIGIDKAFYDIWGDTVNIASRMESHGTAGRLQISDDVRLRLKDIYHLEERGMIPIKNRGSIKTWYVNDSAS